MKYKILFSCKDLKTVIDIHSRDIKLPSIDDIYSILKGLQFLKEDGAINTNTLYSQNKRIDLTKRLRLNNPDEHYYKEVSDMIIMELKGAVKKEKKYRIHISISIATLVVAIIGVVVSILK